ncbi:MAG: hypothetical protein NC548_03825 [Lachnospiraceae bacterium]|nr:hypothetical protein [Lachnospiraceae bacterium]
MRLKKLRIVLGMALIVAMAAVFWNRRTAIYEDITLNVIESQDLTLQPGDRLEQDMDIPYDRLEKVSVAFSYEEGISSDAQALVEVTADGDTVMSQALNVNACSNRGFLDFLVELDGCRGKTVTVSVSNITPKEISNGAFSLMSTDKEFLFLDTVDVCRVNDVETDSCIFCRAVCIRGYSYYGSAVGAFLVFLVGGVIIERLGKRQGRR